MSTLYRKYRPQQFRDVVGQEHVVTTITNAIAGAKTAHAYLLTGPRGVGKTTIARLIAKAVNCEALDTGAEPCNKCPACLAITQGNALDVMEIDAASHTGVDHVREQIIEQARFHAAQLKTKVFIIDEVHMLSTAAFNALLKILEEPPANVIFVLATTELHKVPATIISRCQRFDFHKVATPVMVSVLQQILKLEKVSVPEEVLFRVARASDGCVRDAESLLGQLLALGGGTVTASQADLLLPPSQVVSIVQWLGHLIDKNLPAAIECLNQLADSGVNIEAYTREATEVLRQILLGKIDPALAVDLFQDPVVGESAKRIAVKGDLSLLEHWLEDLLQTRVWFRQTEIPLLPLELFSVRAVGVPESKKSKADDESKRPPGAVKNVKVNSSGQGLTEAWGAIVQEVRKRNTSVGGCLKLGEVLEIEGARVRLGFRYKFYLDRVNDRKNRELVLQVTKELTGQVITLEAVLLEAEAPESLIQAVPAKASALAEQADALLQNVLSTFGGEVVE